jgi:MATE family, multidrug efflux pump
MAAPSSRLRTEVAATARLAGPLIGAQLAYLGLSFIDTVMAGRLSAKALGAVAIGANSWSPLFLLLLGVLMAVPPTVAQLDGAGRRGEIAPFARQALWVGLGVAVVVILAASHLAPVLRLFRVEADLVPIAQGYLDALCWGVPALAVYLLARFVAEGMSEPRPILLIGLLGLPVNVFADWALMYGKLGLPALGAVGCGYATAAVWWCQAAAMGLYLGLRPRYRRLGLFARLEAPRAAEIREVLRVGAPIAVALFSEISMFAVVALVLGSLGLAAVAAHQVALNFVALTFMVPLGFALGITVRVGNAAGRREPAALRFSAFVGTGMAMAAQVVSATLMLTVPRWVIAIYTDDPAVTAVAVQLLFLAALFQLSDGLQVSAAAALRGLKDTRAVMLITLVAYWGVGLPLGYALAFGGGLGARGMWMGLIGGLTVAALLLAGRFLVASGRFARELAAAPGPPGSAASMPEAGG